MTITEQTRLGCYPIRTFPNLYVSGSDFTNTRGVKLFPGAAKKWADNRYIESVLIPKRYFNLLKLAGYVMHQPV